jgi:hypothetical protein
LTFRRPTFEHAVYVAPFAVFLAVYLPAAGHGFIKDDFLWVLQSRVRSLGDFFHLFRQDNGFYRPIVSMTFAVDEWLFGAHPLGYGVTNVLLALACCGAIVSLARGVGLPRGAAWLTASLWLLNFKFTRMGVLWISGRTSLVAALFATMAAAALVRGRLAWATIWIAVALFSKEEALPIAVILAVWLVVLQPRHGVRPVRPVAWLACAAALTGLYFAARSQTSAMTPSSAPDVYRYGVSLAGLARNVAEYADRSMMLAVLVTVLAVGVLGWSRPRPADRAGRIILCGLLWLVLGFAPTMLLPVRSDLYACLPSIGGCLAASAIVSEAWAASSGVRRRRALAGALGLLAVVAPVHYLRTRHWVRPAELSSRILVELETRMATVPQGRRVVIDYDASDPESNLDDAFGSHLRTAVRVHTGRELDISMSPVANASTSRPCVSCDPARFVVVNGRLQ